MNHIEILKARIKEQGAIVERFPGVMNTFYSPVNALINILDKYGYSWEFGYFGAKDGLTIVFFGEKRMYEIGKKLFQEEIQEPGHYQKLREEWEVINNNYYNFIDKLEETDLSKLNLNQLKEFYIKLCKSSSEAWAIPLTANGISVCADKEWIPSLIKKYGQESVEQFAQLSKSVEPSMMRLEEEDLLRIAAKIKTETNFEVLNKEIKEELEKHAKEYHWINNNYAQSKNLDAKYFFERTKELKPIEDKEIPITINFTEEERIQSHLVSIAAFFHDRRKKNNLVCAHFTFKLLKELTKYLDYSYDDLCYLYFPEMIDIFNGKRFPKEEIEKRKKSFIVLSEVGKDTIYSGEEALKIREIINTAHDSQTELKGMCACKGKVQGRVKVILNADEDKGFSKGEILVSSMTRPEFTPLMRKAAAIITNEGGLTCHAAVVSRELGVPCIIGTKAATRILKDGDLVEVNADEGTVKKL